MAGTMSAFNTVLSLIRNAPNMAVLLFAPGSEQVDLIRQMYLNNGEDLVTEGESSLKFWERYQDSVSGPMQVTRR